MLMLPRSALRNTTNLDSIQTSVTEHKQTGTYVVLARFLVELLTSDTLRCTYPTGQLTQLTAFLCLRLIYKELCSLRLNIVLFNESPPSTH
jgi:hypothetical protein